MTNFSILYTEMLVSSWHFQRKQDDSIRTYIAFERATAGWGEVSHLLGFQDQVLDGTAQGRARG